MATWFTIPCPISLHDWATICIIGREGHVDLNDQRHNVRPCGPRRHMLLCGCMAQVDHHTNRLFYRSQETEQVQPVMEGVAFCQLHR